MVHVSAIEVVMIVSAFPLSYAVTYYLGSALYRLYDYVRNP